MIKLWKNCDWFERGLLFGLPSIAAVMIGVGVYGVIAAQNACDEANGSYEKDGTSTTIMVKVGDVFVPQTIHGYHCVVPDVLVVEEVAPVSTMDSYLYGE
jgi:hypothetical protein